VIWGGEFGRLPIAQKGGRPGRDHNPHGFTMLMAGGGVKPGFSFGETDDYGYYAAVDKVDVHDLHATILALLGIDHEMLTFRHGGRDHRLTDVHGRIMKQIFAYSRDSAHRLLGGSASSSDPNFNHGQPSVPKSR
jgi:hypothetical protein